MIFFRKHSTNGTHTTSDWLHINEALHLLTVHLWYQYLPSLLNRIWYPPTLLESNFYTNITLINLLQGLVKLLNLMGQNLGLCWQRIGILQSHEFEFHFWRVYKMILKSLNGFYMHLIIQFRCSNIYNTRLSNENYLSRVELNKVNNSVVLGERFLLFLPPDQTFPFHIQPCDIIRVTPFPLNLLLKH